MKIVQVRYKTSSGNWLADINFEDEVNVLTDAMYIVSKVYNVLTERYGSILDWSILKWYN